jgi:D-alanine-D-alanine ligase
VTVRAHRIAVLAGGVSCEREVSLISGKAVFDAFVSLGRDTVFIDAADDFIVQIRSSGATAVFIALHGTFGEDGTVQRLLEKEGIPYTGSGPQASEVAFDKSRAQALFAKAGLRVPEYRVLEKNAPRPATPFFAVPFVVKPASSGSSVGVTIVRRTEEAQAAYEEAFRWSERILVEEFVKGRELTVGILGDESLPVVEVIPASPFYDYEAKYKSSGTRYEFPARLTIVETERVQRVAMDAYRALGCEVMARVDVILAEDGTPYLLEANTIPGLTGKSLLPKAAKAAGIDFSALCVKILDLSLNRVKVGG